MRSDAAQLHRLLADWDVYVAAAGVVRPWDGRPLLAEHHENNLWARARGSDAWELDITVGDGTADEWVYRRDPAIRLPWADAVLRSAAGVPYLAPEAQLVFKSTDSRRPKDDHDAAMVIPTLHGVHRERLASWLARGHPWQRLLHGS